MIALVWEAHGRRLAVYGSVGVLGAGVNTAILWILVSLAGTNHLLAATLAGELSTLGNFALNDRFTFADHRAPISYWRRALNYNAVAFSGAALSLAALAVLTLGCGVYYLEANLAAMAVSMLSNYALNARFTWSLRLQGSMHSADAAL